MKNGSTLAPPTTLCTLSNAEFIPVMNKVSKLIVVMIATVFWGIPTSVEAGGSWGGSSGGGYAASGGGSSGGGGFFSRLRARHGGSSGGRVAVARASYGGSSGGSSGGVRRRGPIRNLIARMRARRAASGSHGGSSGQVRYASYSGGSSGGSAGSYSTPVSHRSSSTSYGGSSGGVSASYASYSAPVTSAPLAESAVYESPIVESSYQPYTAVEETIIDDGYSTGGAPLGETILDDGYSSGGVTGETIIDGGYDVGIPLGSNPTDATSLEEDRYEVAKPAVDEDSAVLAVRVPPSATVTVNGHETKSNGELRQFMSRGLKEGYVYTYVVKVHYAEEDQVESKSIDLRPGDYEVVTFERKAPVQTVAARKPVVDDSVITVVQLHVPTHAAVSLAGTPTQGTGALRTFRTKQLKRGEQWTDYTVEVTSEVDGQTVTKERTVNVQAGSVTELRFDFDDSPLASR